MAAEATTMSAAELWLELLQQVTGRSAHELKGALNGVAVNLEVVRSRAEHPDAPASRVASFAESASGQLEAVIRMTEALLVLSRPARGRGNVVRTVRALGALLAPAAEVAGKRLTMQLPADGTGETAADPLVVRALLASAMLAAAEGDATVTLYGPGALECTVTRHDGRSAAPDPRLAELASVSGVQLRHDGSALTLSFPPARDELTPEIA
ncbi:MAG: hypothetical protein ACYC3Q_07680 [Gemmatimonadaceae bacterium]